MSTGRSPASELTLADSGAHRVDLLSDACVVDDRSLMSNPADLLARVDRARDEHRRIAVTDVGTRPESLSILPLIEPDIIVLAPELAGANADVSAAARALHVLAAQAERTGAVIIASGVDSERHRRRALALGATYGMGELFPPVSAAKNPTKGPMTTPTWSTPPADSRSPFDIASAEQPSTVSTKQLLIEMSTQIELQASDAGPDTLTLGTFQHASQFSTRTRRRWQTMAARTAYTGVYGIEMADVSTPGIVTCSLDPVDDLVEEWNVVVLGQFFCCTLSAKDLHSGNSDHEREFEYVVSHDRGTVVRCARAVLSRFEARRAARPFGRAAGEHDRTD